MSHLSEYNKFFLLDDGRVEDIDGNIRYIPPKTIDGIKIEKTDEQVVSIRKTTETTFILTDKKGGENEIRIEQYNCDDEAQSYG